VADKISLSGVTGTMANLIWKRGRYIMMVILGNFCDLELMPEISFFENI
jgi:hypothetical protein